MMLLSRAAEQTISETCAECIALYRRGEYSAAAGKLKAAIDEEKRRPTSSEENLLTLYRNLAVVLTGWNHLEEAKSADAAAAELELKLHPKPNETVTRSPNTTNTLKPKFEKMIGSNFITMYGWTAVEKLDHPTLHYKTNTHEDIPQVRPIQMFQRTVILKLKY